jgi:AraC-like DNA-binding protein
MMSINRIEIPNVGLHASCVCYQRDDARTIRRYDLESGAVQSYFLDAHNIVFALNGRVSVSAHNVESGVPLEHGDFVLLPIGTNATFEAHERPASVLLFRLKNLVGQIPECNTFRFHRSAAPAAEKPGIRPLKANDRILHFLEGVLRTEEDGLKCSSYAQLLVGQLLFLIQVYYTQEEYTRFYTAILSPDVVFFDRVCEKWDEYKTITVGELAGALNMTPLQFGAQFGKVFGTTPKAWLQARKAEHVYLDVCSSHKPLKSIAHEYGLSMPNFVRFCRTNFGTTPGALRDSLIVRSGEATAKRRDLRLAQVGQTPKDRICGLPKSGKHQKTGFTTCPSRANTKKRQKQRYKR